MNFSAHFLLLLLVAVMTVAFAAAQGMSLSELNKADPHYMSQG